MQGIDGSVPASQVGQAVAVGVLKLALDSERSAAAKLVDQLQPPAPTPGRSVDVYA